MLYPYPSNLVAAADGTVSISSFVKDVVTAINTDKVIPYGDFGGDKVYWFQTVKNGLGNIVYTVFDRETTMGIESVEVRYGAATTIGQAIFSPMPKGKIDLQFLLLPYQPKPQDTGYVTP